MSSGGLLEKAAKQQTGDANLGTPPNTAAISTVDEGGPNFTMRLIGLIFGGMVVPYFVVMWFGGVFLGVMILPPQCLLASFRSLYWQ